MGFFFLVIALIMAGDCPEDGACVKKTFESCVCFHLVVFELEEETTHTHCRWVYGNFGLVQLVWGFPSCTCRT